MIKSFNHKGLKRFYLSGDTRGIQHKHKSKLQNILAVLDVMTDVQDINFPSYSLHQLKGELSGKWSVQVNGNWRVIFEFIDGDVYVVDYLGYH